MHGSAFRRDTGFTMIEMLVTLTVFAMAMSALVVGLHTGIRVWRTVRIHQTQMASVERALRTISNDLRHLVVISDEEPPLIETVVKEGDEQLSMTSLGSRRMQRVGIGPVWSRIDYRLRASEDESSTDMIRVVVPHVGREPMRDSEQTDVLLEGVKSIQFGYLGTGGEQPNWEEKEHLPAAVSVEIEFVSGRTVAKTVQVPCGFLTAG